MIANLQVLRGLAALLVFFHHSLSHFYAMGLSFPFFEWIARYGFFGVDIFFVLSGLVMAKTTEHLSFGKESSFGFLKKRFLRIFLGYWPMFLLALLITNIYMPAKLEQVNWYGSLFLLSTKTEELLILPSWSLTYELLFYTLIGFALLREKLITWLIPGIVLATLLKVSLMSFNENQLLDVIFSPFIFEFLMGYGFWKMRNSLNSMALIWVSVFLVFAGLYFGIVHDTVNSTWRVFTYGLTALGSVVLFIRFEYLPKSWLHALFHKIGDASYTLYLLHIVLLMVFWGSGLRQWLVNQDIAGLGFVAMILLVSLVSWVVYTLLEKPLYTWSVKSFVKRSKKQIS